MSNNTLTAVAVFVLSYTLLVAAAFAACKAHLFRPRQMRKWGLLPGVPFIGNGGVLSEFLVLSPWLAVVVYRCANLWVFRDVLGSLVIGFALSLSAHLSIARSHAPDALGYRERITMSGRFHIAYATVALTIVSLLYTCTDAPPAGLVWWSTYLLIAHLVLANHMPLGIVKPRWYGGKPHGSVARWTIVIVSSSLLIWRSVVITR